MKKIIGFLFRLFLSLPYIVALVFGLAIAAVLYTVMHETD